jgi:hypothetical protein
VGPPLSPYVRYDADALTNDIYEFVTERNATVRNALAVAHAAQDSPAFPVPFEVMETMVLDGVEDRQDVANLVDYAVNWSPLPPHEREGKGALPPDRQDHLVPDHQQERQRQRVDGDVRPPPQHPDPARRRGRVRHLPGDQQGHERGHHYQAEQPGQRRV